MAEPQAVVPDKQTPPNLLNPEVEALIDVGDTPPAEPVPTELTGDEPTAEEAERIAAEEEEARSTSEWVSKDEWLETHGNLKGWKPAGEYLEFRRAMLPLVQKENRELRERLKRIEERDATREAERTKRTQEIERETLRMELRTARENQDWDRVDEITDKLLDLKMGTARPAAPANTEAPPELKAAFGELASRNPWLAPGPKQDKQMTREFARELNVVLQAVGTYDDVSDAMRQAVNKVRRLYPEKFRTRPAAMGESGGEPGNTGPRGRTWNDLKPEARKELEEFITGSTGVDGKATITREGILKNCGPDDFIRRSA